MQDLNLETSASVLSEVSPPFVIEMKLLTVFNIISVLLLVTAIYYTENVGTRSSTDMLLRSEVASDLDNPADRFINIQLVTQSL